MEDKYIACMLLHATGDAIGFKNGEWEFNHNTSNFDVSYVLEIVYEFIDLGGINHLSTKDWKISDDTIMHMKTAETLLEEYTSLNTYGNILKKKYIEAYNKLEKEPFRIPGLALMKYLKRLKEGGKWNDTPYDYMAGGSGASMRTSCIGLAYYGEDNRTKLIQVAIESSRITHNSATGYLGGMTSALFTAYALEGIPTNFWPYMLMELFDTGVIEDIIIKSGRGKDNYYNDSNTFINKWKHYINDKFDDERIPIKRRLSRNLVFRGKYYFDNYSYKEALNPGSGGDDSVIIAYDCLIDSNNSWEKLAIYSMMHVGDTDTTGCIAASWWGAVNGFYDVPDINYKNLECKDELIKLGKMLYKKYSKNIVKIRRDNDKKYSDMDNE
jgi:ADP-ribosylglycohydrolase